jgi:hypothetical protein
VFNVSVWIAPVLTGRIGSPAAACSIAGGFCYRMLSDESCIAHESQNSPAPARASDRLLSGNLHEKHDIVSFFLGKRSLPERSQHRVSEGHGWP